MKQATKKGKKNLKPVIVKANEVKEINKLIEKELLFLDNRIRYYRNNAMLKNAIACEVRRTTLNIIVLKLRGEYNE